MWHSRHDDAGLSRAIWPAVALCAVAYFGYHMFEGRYGLSALYGYKDEIARLQPEAASLSEQRARLQRKVDLLDPRRAADPDLVDEEVRRRLGYVAPDEFVIQTD